MSKMIKLTINDLEIEVADGTLLIEAAKKAGVEIPHFCYHPKLKPDANCRMCIVEVEKARKLQTSCSTPAVEGMVVKTNSPQVKEAQFGVMEFLLGNHPLDCPECDQGGECQLQDFAHQNSPTTSRFVEEKRIFKKEYFGPLIEKEMNRCVSCLRCVRYCDEVIGSNALGSMERGNMHEIGAFAHQELECEYCGGCIQICPVGALTSRLSMYDTRTWQLQKTETICNYCGDGCLLTLEGVKDDITRVSSELGAGRNEGDLCARGFFGYGMIHHPDRLSRPTVRLQGRDLQVTWDWAMDKAATGLTEIKAKYGPEAIGGVISAHCTNEEIYLFQKLMRQTIGSPHIDSSARLGYINAATGLMKAFGTTRLVRYEDILQADVLLVFAGEMTESNPITAIKVKEAVRKNKAKLIAVDSYSAGRETYISHLPNLATHHLEIRSGTEGTAIVGLMKAVVEGSPSSSLSQAALNKLKESLAPVSYKNIEAVTGIPEKTFREMGTLYAGAERGVIIFGRAITRCEEGYQNVLKLADLAIAAGQAGQAGKGILPLTKENNEFGAVEMGGGSEYLPGLQPTDPARKGHTLVEMIDAAIRGEIKALYLVGENPFRSLPQKKVEEALSKLELLICQDLFPSEVSSLAHIVLPAASYAEKAGRFTNLEGEIQKGRKAIEPVGNSKPDWEIFSLLERKLAGNLADPSQSQKLQYLTVDEIWREIVTTLPASWPKISDEGILEKMASHIGDGSRSYVLPNPPEDKEEGVFDLFMGQVIFHAGRMSTYAPGLTTLLEKEIVLIHPDDAESLDLQEGEEIELKVSGSDPGVMVPVKFSKKLSEGSLLFPEHFGMEMKALLPLTVDPTTGVPYGDRGRVILSKVSVSVQ
ncbi:MAG: NADH-quinone oxidoreductase subunit NuoG [Nitrospira sp.]|nr:NADH-quinone oxidoreductase subunit NuoG [Candidatus Manganitrophaceae bacterium]HIL35364.1 NADH dehydrogenase (quinone) subunit G [Candidatus Manganitrophaceae bacterium]